MEDQVHRARARRMQRARVQAVVTFAMMVAVFGATIILLGVASHTRSPDGTNVQTEQGACHNPSVFIALLGMSTARLGLCILARVWTFFRSRRRAAAAARARIEVLELEARRVDERRAQAALLIAAQLRIDDEGHIFRRGDNGATLALRHRDAVTESTGPLTGPSAQSLPLPQLGGSENFEHCDVALARSASAPGEHRSIDFAIPEGGRLISEPPSQSPANPPRFSYPPSLSNGRVAPAPIQHLPCKPAPARFESRASSSRGSLPSSEVRRAVGTSGDDMISSHAGPSSVAVATTTTMPVDPEQRFAPSSSVVSVASGSRASIRFTPSHPPSPSSSFATSQSRESKSERRRRRHKKWAATADSLASQVNNSMTIVHFVLWLIGSAVCFAQLPTVNEENCYDSAPLLWWPLMLTTIIFGWLHAVYYALVVVGASIILVVSGIYLILAHFMGWPVRPILGMHRPRTPQPETLTEDDLKACPIVAYIPDPNEPLPEPSIYAPSKAGSINEGTSSQGVASAMLKKAMGIDAKKSAPPSPEEPKGQPVAPGEADPARLGLPGVVLSAHQVTCAICQSSFLPPREVFGKEMYLVERLRQLPCKHVFHVECVDNWLVNHSGICPYCSQNVKDMIETKKAEAEDASPSGGAAGGAAPHRRGEGEV